MFIKINNTYLKAFLRKKSKICKNKIKNLIQIYFLKHDLVDFECNHHEYPMHQF